jgi:hypothetical protein
LAECFPSYISTRKGFRCFLTDRQEVAKKKGSFFSGVENPHRQKRRQGVDFSPSVDIPRATGGKYRRVPFFPRVEIPIFDDAFYLFLQKQKTTYRYIPIWVHP